MLKFARGFRGLEGRPIVFGMAVFSTVLIICSLIAYFFRVAVGLGGLVNYVSSQNISRLNFLFQSMGGIAFLHAIGVGITLGRMFRMLPFWRAVSAFLPAMVIIIVGTFLSFKESSEQHSLRLILPWGGSDAYFWGTLFSAMLIAVQEELFNRALIQSMAAGLTRNRYAGLVVSFIFFTLTHPLENIAIVAPGALLLSYVFMKTESVLMTIFMHFSLNLSFDLLFGTNFTAVAWLGADLKDSVAEFYLVGVAGFIAVDMWHATRTPDCR